MRYLNVNGVIQLHGKAIAASGGSPGLRDRGALESAVAQPRMTFGEQDLYPTLVDKAAALGFSLIKNHPFVDGNKRIGHYAMELFLSQNGHETAPLSTSRKRSSSPLRRARCSASRLRRGCAQVVAKKT